MFYPLAVRKIIKIETVSRGLQGILDEAQIEGIAEVSSSPTFRGFILKDGTVIEIHELHRNVIPMDLWETYNLTTYWIMTSGIIYIEIHGNLSFKQFQKLSALLKREKDFMTKVIITVFQGGTKIFDDEFENFLDAIDTLKQFL